MLQNVPHQIVQSPARLGLPNPNSPSLQAPAPPKFTSQNPQSLQPNPHSNLSVTPTSLTLLPLLPPLSRAQAILTRMAFLASRLFEVSPNRSQWLSTFRGSFPSFLSAQTQSSFLPSQESPPSSSKETVSLVVTLQTQLFQAVTELQEILDLQDAKQKVVREIRAKDSTLLAFANKLKEAERVLDILVDDYSDYHRLKRMKVEDTEEDSSTTTVATQLNLSDILSYAHRISYTTFAPPEFGAGQAPLRGALPPAPQEEQMRASQLYQFADLDVGLPKSTEIKETYAIEPFAESQVPANLMPSKDVMEMMLPSKDIMAMLRSNIKVPEGWKEGDPIELPHDFPKLPIDRQPPPIQVRRVALDIDEQQPPITEEQRPRPLPVLPPKPNEPIQVRHVKLDIDDDSSSDYSSDDETSDDED